MDRKCIASELLRIAGLLTREARGPMVYLEMWEGRVPVLSIHNRYYRVKREGVDLGEMTGISDLDGWVVDAIYPKKEYIELLSPDGTYYEVAYGYPQAID